MNYYNGEKSYSNLTWVQGRQLASITTGGKTYAYSYDADGIRTQKVVDGVTHTYVTQNGKVMRETIGSGTTAKVLDFIYDNTGKPFALRYSTNGGSSYATYYYVLNLQGDVVKLVRIYAGTTIQEYEEMASYTYNAWGEILSATGTMAEINPIRYRGYYYDTETGFYYLQSRYYDPANHRFINADILASTGQGFIGTNMFAYCNNNPINLEDSAGAFPISSQQNKTEFMLYGSNDSDIEIVTLPPPNFFYDEGIGLSYDISEDGNSVEIPNSYLVWSPFAMYEYIEMNRGDEVHGSTMGVVFECMMHNAGYAFGVLTGNQGWIDAGKSVEFGNTIFDDHREGYEDTLMHVAYFKTFPIYAIYDLVVYCFK